MDCIHGNEYLTNSKYDHSSNDAIVLLHMMKMKETSPKVDTTRQERPH